MIKTRLKSFLLIKMKTTSKSNGELEVNEGSNDQLDQGSGLFSMKEENRCHNNKLSPQSNWLNKKIIREDKLY